MTKTEALPGVDAYADELAAAVDNKPMKYHRVCPSCYPKTTDEHCEMGTPAVCGEKVLGIPATHTGAECGECKVRWARHVMNHMYNGGGSRG